MNLSTHYYVLGLGDDSTRLYEGFRDDLIDIRNAWFPLESVGRPAPQVRTDDELRALLQQVDRHFAHYSTREPLGLVLVGTARLRSAFASLAVHSGAIIGQSDGDPTTTSLETLGCTAWAIVKGAMATAGHGVEQTLEAATRAGNVAIGLGPVVHSLDAGLGGTLLVEEDYRVVPRDIAALLEDCDNVVDVVVDRVLARGGNVKFVNDGSLARFGHIVLVLRDTPGGGNSGAPSPDPR